MIHRQTVQNYPGTLAELATELGDLRYDALAEFLQSLSAKLAKDAEADAARGRKKLTTALTQASANLTQATENVQRAWEICEPHTQ